LLGFRLFLLLFASSLLCSTVILCLMWLHCMCHSSVQLGLFCLYISHLVFSFFHCLGFVGFLYVVLCEWVFIWCSICYNMLLIIKFIGKGVMFEVWLSSLQEQIFPHFFFVTFWCILSKYWAYYTGRCKLFLIAFTVFLSFFVVEQNYSRTYFS
jgi:hypothetical protein